MSRKAKWIVAIAAILSAAVLAVLGALPYGYMIQGFLMGGGGNAMIDAAWVLYVVVAVLLALALWRLLYVAVLRRPRRMGEQEPQAPTSHAQHPTSPRR